MKESNGRFIALLYLLASTLLTVVVFGFLIHQFLKGF